MKRPDRLTLCLLVVLLWVCDKNVEGFEKGNKEATI